MCFHLAKKVCEKIYIFFKNFDTPAKLKRDNDAAFARTYFVAADLKGTNYATLAKLHHDNLDERPLATMFAVDLKEHDDAAFAKMRPDVGIRKGKRCSVCQIAPMQC